MNDNLDVGPPEEYVHSGLLARNTCNADPEDYLVFRGEAVVGYMHLRSGIFRAEAFYPGQTKEGEIVFKENPMGDGMFLDEERAGYLNKALEAIEKWLNGK